MKKTSIGFKSCVENEDKKNEEMQMPSPAQIREEVVHDMNAEREYEEHMESYHNLILQNRLFKRIGISIGIVLAMAIIYVIGYFNGAKHQITNNGPYAKITDIAGQTHIIFKK